MDSDTLPSFSLTITPKFEGEEAVELAFQLILHSPDVEAGESLVLLHNKMGNGNTQCYTASQIAVTDENGPLEIDTTDGGPRNRLRSYNVQRATQGDVLLDFTAIPVHVTDKTPISGRYELKRDQGGLMFMGISVIPIPFDGDVTTKIRHKMTVRWNLNNAPSRMRAVSTFAEAPTIVERTGPSFEIWRAFFAVGPLKCYPSPETSSVNNPFGFYWFGNPPETITSLAPLCESVFLKMSKFFKETITPANPYRIFVRCATPSRGFGGTGGYRSFMLEYDAAIDILMEHDIFYLLAHEIVHNWPLLQGVPNSIEDDDFVAWYNEGIADYYGTILPYRLGIRSKEDFVTRFNGRLSEYFTNPYRDVSNKTIAQNQWSSPFYQTLPYSRGMLYFCQMDDAIRRATDGKHSVDDVVLELLENARKEKPYGVNVWKDCLRRFIGSEADEKYNDMMQGKLIALPLTCFQGDLSVVREDQRVIDFGLELGSFATQIVRGLKEDSNAEKAGLRDGDQIVKALFTWQCQKDYNKKMWLRVQRSKEIVEIEYWPRSSEYVECYQLRLNEIE